MGHKTSPCTATFNDLLCLTFGLFLPVIFRTKILGTFHPYTGASEPNSFSTNQTYTWHTILKPLRDRPSTLYLLADPLSISLPSTFLYAVVFNAVTWTHMKHPRTQPQITWQQQYLRYLLMLLMYSDAEVIASISYAVICLLGRHIVTLVTRWRCEMHRVSVCST
jgi:hypothetical protein